MLSERGQGGIQDRSPAKAVGEGCAGLGNSAVHRRSQKTHRLFEYEPTWPVPRCNLHWQLWGISVAFLRPHNSTSNLLLPKGWGLGRVESTFCQKRAPWGSLISLWLCRHGANRTCFKSRDVWRRFLYFRVYIAYTSISVCLLVRGRTLPWSYGWSSSNPRALPRNLAVQMLNKS